MRKHADDDRKTLYADVCVSAANGIDAVARRIGCSRAAMLDALGHALSSPALLQVLEEHPAWPAIVEKAREIDADRRDRRPRNGR